MDYKRRKLDPRLFKKRTDAVDYDLFKTLIPPLRRKIAQYYIHGRWLPQIGFWQQKTKLDICLRSIRAIGRDFDLPENQLLLYNDDGAFVHPIWAVLDQWIFAAYWEVINRHLC